MPQQSVRFTYTDPINCGICKLVLEDTIEKAEGNLSATSRGSKTDYVCYILTWEETSQVSASNTIRVPVVMLETKCLQTQSKKVIAQALGYYRKSQGFHNPSQQGIAILLNVSS